MVSTKEVAGRLGLDPKQIRKFARKHFEKRNGEWDFTEAEINKIKEHLTGSPRIPAVKSTKAPEGLSLEYLTSWAKSFLKENYNLDLIIPLKINSRITKTLGFFSHRRGNGKEKQPVAIDLASKLFQYYSKEEVLDVLRHELIHYALYMLGKPYKDGEHCFESELAKHGTSSTHTIQRKGPAHQYCCTSCGQVVANRSRQIRNTAGYRSNCCKSDIEYKGKVIL